MGACYFDDHDDPDRVKSPAPLWLRHALWWLQRHSLYERWANTIWYALHRREPSWAEIELAAEDLYSEFEAVYAEHDIDEPMYQWFSRSGELFHDVRDRDRAFAYYRAADLAIERRGREHWRLDRRPPSPDPRSTRQTSLPPTRARESRPRRRTAKALAGGDGDPEPEPLDARNGRLGVGAA